jgi:alanine-glyoxylate transaminase/serine-glyoxylate transaminase/serine-pyruvate transaminase
VSVGKLFTPGPVEVPPEVLKASCSRIVSHRGEGFHRLYRRVVELLARLYRLDSGFVAVLAGSGTTAVDAMAWSLVRRGERVLVLVHGEFGRRLAETLERRGATVEALEAPRPGAPVPVWDAVERLEAEGFDAVALVHNETSVGLAYRDLPRLASAAARAGVRLLVDTVSGLGGEEFDMRWGVTAAASASQKAIAAPPGAAFVAVRGEPSYADDVPLILDLARYERFSLKSETPFTPPVTVLYALLAALERIEGVGYERYVMQHRERARILYEELPRYGLHPLVEDERYRSNTVAAFYTPVSASRLKRELERKGYIIATGMGELKDKIVRIGVMGNVTVEDVQSLVEAVGDTVRRLR